MENMIRMKSVNLANAISMICVAIRNAVVKENQSSWMDYVYVIKTGGIEEHVFPHALECPACLFGQVDREMAERQATVTSLPHEIQIPADRPQSLYPVAFSSDEAENSVKSVIMRNNCPCHNCSPFEKSVPIYRRVKSVVMRNYHHCPNCSPFKKRVPIYRRVKSIVMRNCHHDNEVLEIDGIAMKAKGEAIELFSR